MRDTKLIMLDGLPGSGTSTQAIWLENKLVEQKILVKRYHEFDRDNPLNWVEWWNGGMEAVLEAYKQLDKTMAHSLSKWKEFVANLPNSKEIVILENLPFQITMGLFIQGDADEAELMAYGLEVRNLIQALQPVIIYFYPSDINWALNRILAIRGAEFEEPLTQNMNRVPYLKNRGLQGKEGIVQLWEYTQERHQKLFEQFTIPILKIDFTEENWEQYRTQIVNFLEL